MTEDEAPLRERLARIEATALGIWWALAWIAGGLVVVVGALAWLLEHQVQIIVRP